MSIIEINNTQEFETLLEHEERVLFLIFHASWCQPCQRLKKFIVEEESKYPNILFCKVDIDLEDNEDLVKKYKIQSISHTVVFKDKKFLCELKGYNPTEYKKLMQSV